MGERVLDTSQAAARLGCTRAHVGTLIRTGKIKAVDIGVGEKLPRWRIPEQSLIEYMQRPEEALASRIKTR